MQQDLSIIVNKRTKKDISQPIHWAGL